MFQEIELFIRTIKIGKSTSWNQILVLLLRKVSGNSNILFNIKYIFLSTGKSFNFKKGKIFLSYLSRTLIAAPSLVAVVKKHTQIFELKFLDNSGIFLCQFYLPTNAVNAQIGYSERPINWSLKLTTLKMNITAKQVSGIFKHQSKKTTTTKTKTKKILRLKQFSV